MRAYYGLTWADPSNYDLCLDTAALGPQGSAEIIVRAVEAR
jgi:cytidylate kinase